MTINALDGASPRGGLGQVGPTQGSIGIIAALAVGGLIAYSVWLSNRPKQSKRSARRRAQ